MGRFYNPRSKICKDAQLHLDLSIARDFDNSITRPLNAENVASSDWQFGLPLLLDQSLCNFLRVLKGVAGKGVLSFA